MPRLRLGFPSSLGGERGLATAKGSDKEDPGQSRGAESVRREFGNHSASANHIDAAKKDDTSPVGGGLDFAIQYY